MFRGQFPAAAAARFLLLPRHNNFSQRTHLKKMNIIGLDFDGVLCASAEESSTSALLAAKKVWPTLFQRFEPHSKNFDDLRKLLLGVRPVIEVGFDSVLLTRFIFDNVFENQTKNSFEVSKYIFDNWSANFREELIKNYNTSRSELMEAFGSTRDALMKADLHHWVSLNPLYPEVLSYFNNTKDSIQKDKLFIITTKQERFVRAILSENKIDWMILDGASHKHSPTDSIVIEQGYSNIYDFENRFGSKLNVLFELSKQYSENSLTKFQQLPIIHFVEDRFDTLIKIRNHLQQEIQKLSNESTTSSMNNQELVRLKNFKLYLVDWGYNTEQQRNYVRELGDENLQLINYQQFHELMNKIC